MRLRSYLSPAIRILFAVSLTLSAASRARANPLRVCADPNNLPFSNNSGEGFENHLAQLIGKALNEPVAYTWWAQRRGYVRNTIKAGQCDIWPGVATGVDMLATTQPYYRSTYVFVTRTDRNLEITSLEDPRLGQLQIGVQMVGDDANNTPPAHALAERGIVHNVHGYMLYGDYNQPEPQRAIIDAVETGKVDVAIVWGPIAGYFAAEEPKALSLRPVLPHRENVWPMTFAISMGVRRGNSQLRDQLNRALEEQRSAITALLNEYHVPQVSLKETGSHSAEATADFGINGQQQIGQMHSIWFER